VCVAVGDRIVRVRVVCVDAGVGVRLRGVVRVRVVRRIDSTAAVGVVDRRVRSGADG
jgi:hypothetical protein